MYRLFVAIDLPEDVRKAVIGICSGVPDAKWLPAEQLHLTLRFIGEVDEKGFAAIKRSLAGVAAAPFSLFLQGAGAFPSPKRPRVIWVGMERNENLLQLQKEVELALIAADILPEERKFSPHITLARLKESHPAAVASFQSRHCGFTAGPFPVEEFHLYSSILSTKGAIHRREATYPLILQRQ